MLKRSILTSIFWGGGASVAMLLAYLAILLATMPASEVWPVLRQYWYFTVPIIIGFGTQVGLWTHLKHCRVKHASASVPAVAGTMSGTAMLACCAHHLVDVVPILGISGAAILLARYQLPLLMVSLFINVLGIAYMMYLIQKHRFTTEGVHSKLQGYDEQ